MHISKVEPKISVLIHNIDHYINQKEDVESCEIIKEIRDKLFSITQQIYQYPYSVSHGLYAERFFIIHSLNDSLDIIKLQDELHPQAELNAKILKTISGILKGISHHEQAAKVWYELAWKTLKKNPTEADMEEFFYILKEGLKKEFLLLQHDFGATIFHKIVDDESYMPYLSLLKDVGLSPEILNSSEQNPFCMAIEHGNIKMAQAIIMMFGSDNYLNGDGKTEVPLISMIMRRNHHGKKHKKIEYLKLIEMILATDINVNQQTNAGYTALHKACQYRDVRVIERLLKAGARLDIANKDQQTSLDMLADEMALSQAVNDEIEEGCRVLLSNWIAQSPTFAGVSFSW
ncbi:MAG: ankyrin repeat domain-containing protein [Chlamydiota bacterium]